VDRTITQLVRQGVVDEYGVTTDTANVTIVTVDRVVTLRGPANSETEQSTIGAIAQRVDRVRQVDNQLEVASQ
jgi:osmotically-inducible protein OsmY